MCFTERRGTWTVDSGIYKQIGLDRKGNSSITVVENLQKTLTGIGFCRKGRKLEEIVSLVADSRTLSQRDGHSTLSLLIHSTRYISKSCQDRVSSVSYSQSISNTTTPERGRGVEEVRYRVSSTGDL